MKIGFFFIIVLLVGCEFWETNKTDPSFTTKTRQALRDSDYSAMAALPNTSDAGVSNQKTAEQRATEKRIALLSKEFSAYETKTIVHSKADAGGGKDAEMITHLLAAARYVNEIYKIQVHANNLIWEKQLSTSGESIERDVFARYFGPWCRLSTDEQCNAIASVPKKETGTVFWPIGFSATAFERIGKMINSRELLAPFSLVANEKNGRLRSIAYAGDPRFARLFSQLSASFSQAAQQSTGKEKVHLLYLSSVAKSEDIYTMGQSVDTFNTGDSWVIRFGAFETNLDVHLTKPSFELSVGKLYTPIQGELEKYRKNQDAIFDAYMASFGEFPVEPYAFRSFPDIEVVDNWFVAGRARDTENADARVLQLPFIPTEKKVVLSTNDCALALERMNQILATVAPGELVGLDALLNSRLVRETVSTILPNGETMIAMDTGRKMSVKRFAKQQTARTLDLLRTLASVWLISVENEKWKLTDEAIRDRINTFIAQLLVHLSMSSSSETTASQQTAAWILNGYLASGAVNWQNGKLDIQYQKVIGDSIGWFSRLRLALHSGNRKEIDALYDKFGGGEGTGVDTSGGTGVDTSGGTGVDASGDIGVVLSPPAKDILGKIAEIDSGRTTLLAYVVE